MAACGVKDVTLVCERKTVADREKFFKPRIHMVQFRNTWLSRVERLTQPVDLVLEVVETHEERQLTVGIDRFTGKKGVQVHRQFIQGSHAADGANTGVVGL